MKLKEYQMRDKKIAYEIVIQDEWEKRLNELLVED